MRTLISIELFGLAKLSCTPPQHTGMSVEVSSVGGEVHDVGRDYIWEKNRYETYSHKIHGFSSFSAPHVFALTRDNHFHRH